MSNAAQACNLSQLLRQTAALHPDRAGLIQGERQWTWREIDARVDALVAALRRLGIVQGDRLLVQSRTRWRCSRAAGSRSASAPCGCR